MSKNCFTRALLAVCVVMAHALQPAFVHAEELSPTVLNALLNDQPDHEADYEWTASGETFQVRYAQKGDRVLCGLGAGRSGVHPNEYVLRDQAGALFRVSTVTRTYSECTDPKLLVVPVLASLAAQARSGQSKVSGESGPERQVAGHPTITCTIRFASGETSAKVVASAAKDLRLLVVKGQWSSGRDKIDYSLANVALDPPDSLFVIPAGFTRVEESVLAVTGESGESRGLPDAGRSEYFETTSSGFRVEMTGPPFSAAHSVLLSPVRELAKGAVLEASFEVPGGDSVLVRQSFDGGKAPVLLESPLRPDWELRTYGVSIRIYADSTRREMLGTHMQRSRMNTRIADAKTVEELVKMLGGGR